MVEFYLFFERWLSFFSSTGTRIHVSTSDVFPESEALHAALAEAGGVSVTIQRSIELEPYLFRRTVVDVHFAYARSQREKERLSGSSVRQSIVCGYPFDQSFPAARANGRVISDRLRSFGVDFTVCFFDENDGVLPKRFGGRRQTQEDYRFLCRRLEEDKKLGLVLKPKRAKSLPSRLGPVWPSVQRLIDSGRCVLLSGDSPDKNFLPCAGACAADLAINILGGATAGLEARLAGIPTLLIRHGADDRLFGQLPKGTVAFGSWEELWKAVEQFRSGPADPRIGDWQPVLEEIVQLRDGRAAERIGSYLQTLYRAFSDGKSREEALEEAARVYSSQWGEGLIAEIVQGRPARETEAEIPASIGALSA